jgi:hypothetical protein
MKVRKLNLKKIKSMIFEEEKKESEFDKVYMILQFFMLISLFSILSVIKSSNDMWVHDVNLNPNKPLWSIIYADISERNLTGFSGGYLLSLLMVFCITYLYSEFKRVMNTFKRWKKEYDKFKDVL